MLAKITYGSEKRRKITEKSVAERENTNRIISQKSEVAEAENTRFTAESL